VTIFHRPGEQISETPEDLILPVEVQILAWEKARRMMSWDIKRQMFERIAEPPSLTQTERTMGFVGPALFYGFGDDGAGNADCVLSGKTAWEYARKRLGRKIWQSPHIDFERADTIRLRPAAPTRPKGFYFALINPGRQFLASSVSEARKKFNATTGFASEGFQLLCITHPHLPDLMSERKIPFMALADYDVAPYGFNDFFDAPQLFSSNRILGLGIGNVEYNYPGFGIPAMIIRLESLGKKPR
jgi:hypothetical protein